MGIRERRYTQKELSGGTQTGTYGERQQDAYVRLHHVNKSFGNFKASDDVSFCVEKGKLIALLGPSGSGKTTILRILAGLESADSGDIFIDVKRVNDIPASKRGIGFVFQSYALFRYKTVFENIAFGLRIQKKSKGEIRDRVGELIRLVGLEGMEKRYPNQLSGGQRQRVAFARALATQPSLLLLDEPFAAIDAKVRKELRSWLRELISRVGITSIFVTHDQDEAIEVADEIIVTNRGRIEQIGAPIDIYRNPETAFVTQFIGQPVILEDLQRFNGFSQVEKNVRAVLRPEYVLVNKTPSRVRYPVTAEDGVVESTAFRGTDIELCIRVKDTRILAYRQLTDNPIEAGEKVKVFINCVYVLDGERAYTLENASLRYPGAMYI